MRSKTFSPFPILFLVMAVVLGSCSVDTEGYKLSRSDWGSATSNLQLHGAQLKQHEVAVKHAAVVRQVREIDLRQRLSIPDLFSDNITFTENKGQLENVYKLALKDISQVKFYTRSFGGTAYFAEEGIAFGFLKWKLDLANKMKDSEDPANERIKKNERNYQSTGFNIRFLHKAQQAKLTGIGKQEATLNYFHGNDASQYVTDIHNYNEIVYEQLYDHVDLKYYLKGSELQYDYVIHPGGNPKDIQLQYEGVTSLSVNANGELEIGTDWGILTDKKLYCYQQVGGQKKEVQVKYKVTKGNVVSFEVVSGYDKSLDLIIDPPTLTWSTFMGANDPAGNGYIHDIILDASGNVYGTGWYNDRFPMNGAFDGVFGGDEQIVFKMNSTGTALAYSSFIGGGNLDYAFGIDVDATGNAYVTGYTNSTDFPTAGGPARATNSGLYDITISKINAAGSALVYSGYYGGTASDYGFAIAVNGSNEAYITGMTASNATMSTGGAYQTAFGGGTFDAFVLKLNAAGTTVQYCTYYGGTGDDIGRDIEVNGAGNAFIGGATNSSAAIASAGSFSTTFGGGTADGFVAQINNAGTTRVYGAYIGGVSEDKVEELVLNGSGQAILYGYTRSYSGAGGFPSVNAFQANNGAPAGGPRDAFMAHVNGAGTALLTSTFLGTAVDEQNRNPTPFDVNTQHKSGGVSVNSSGNIAIAIVTDATNLPTVNSVDATHNGGNGGLGDVYIAVFSTAENTLDFTTYLGGSEHDYATGGIRFDPSNQQCIVVGGANHSDQTTFPTTAGVYMTARGANTTNDQGFITKYCSVVLPVELTSFTAKVNDHKEVVLDWTTVMEKNNDFFEVQRSVDGVHFEKIGVVAGAGNSTNLRSYQFIDQEPLPGTSYYRLCQTDYDGAKQHSNIISLNISSLDGLLLYPNPTNGELYISHFFGDQMDIEIRIIDALGRTLLTQRETVTKGVYKNTIDLGSYANGVYAVEIRTPSDVLISKVTKK